MKTMVISGSRGGTLSASIRNYLVMPAKRVSQSNSGTAQRFSDPEGTPHIFRFETLSSPLSDPGYLVQVRRQLSQDDTWKHEHVYHEIVLVESGTAEHLTETGVQKLHPGDIIVIKPRMWHAYRKTQDFQIINCLFDRRILKDHFKLITMVHGAFELFLRPSSKQHAAPPVLLHANPAQKARMLENLETIISEMDQREQDWKAVVVLRLIDFLIFITRLSRGGFHAMEKSLSNHAREAVEQAVAFLESNYREDVSLSRIATHFHICPSYLSRVFSCRMGMSLVQYLHHVRVEEACRRLRSSHTAISEIATDVGYNEIAYFSRRFRKETGISAMEYRKKYRGR